MEAIAGGEIGALNAMTATGIIAITTSRPNIPTSSLYIISVSPGRSQIRFQLQRTWRAHRSFNFSEKAISSAVSGRRK